MLKGAYYFRQVYYQIGYNDGSLSDAATAYGVVTFDGNGGFASSLNGTTFLDAQGGGQYLTLKGTYSIAASGYGFMSNPIVANDTIYGVVNQQGIFIGGDTESLNGYNDLFIAVPVSSPAPTAASFKGNYTLAYMDLSGGSPQYTLNAMIQMSPNGVNNLGTVSVTGYQGGSGSTKIPASSDRHLRLVQWRDGADLPECPIRIFLRGNIISIFLRTEISYLAGRPAVSICL